MSKRKKHGAVQSKSSNSSISNFLYAETQNEMERQLITGSTGSNHRSSHGGA
jgi:hypothetical protein